jgi:serine/threonine protein kinase
MAQSQNGSLVDLQVDAPSAAVSPCCTIVEGGHADLKSGSTLPFHYIGKLGVGASAVVDIVEDSTNGRTFAQKVFRPYCGHNKFFKEAFKNEVDIIKRLHSHAHIIQVYWSYTCGREFGMLLTPVASDKDLAAYLLNIQDTGKGHTPEQRTILLRGFGCLASGLAHIHRHTIRHKDIKPQNILVHNGRMIYTDFGIALDASEQQGTTTTGLSESFTMRYCAPEVANHEPRNRKSDVFSLGCVFMEMMVLLDPLTRLDTQDPRPYRQRAQTLGFTAQFVDSAQPADRFYILYRICALMTARSVAVRVGAAHLLNLLWLAQFSRNNVDLELFCACCKGLASVAHPLDADMDEGLRFFIERVRKNYISIKGS